MEFTLEEDLMANAGEIATVQVSETKINELLAHRDIAENKTKEVQKRLAIFERRLGVQAAELELHKQKYLAALAALRLLAPRQAEEIEGWA